MTRHEGTVSVVVIAYNDAARVQAAVESALRQGPAVREIIVIDDASTDETAAKAALSAARDDRVRVHTRSSNSGGCGTPRNDGLERATAPWVMFLDSDDVLPDGAVAELLEVATAYTADVAAGVCVRKELPSGTESVWQPQLFAGRAVHDGIAASPELLWDTLSVNKLYRRGFLIDHDIRFPDGAAHYEDFVFTARLYAASPRLAVTPARVYVWHVRRAAEQVSISLRRDTIVNWLDRLAAHRSVLDTLSSSDTLVAHAWVKFVSHDIALYVAELGARTDEYRREWWTATREHLRTRGLDALLGAPVSVRWAAEAIAGAEAPHDLVRLRDLLSDAGSLRLPYVLKDDVAVWSETAPTIVLDGWDTTPAHELPILVHGRFSASGPGPTLTLVVHEMYGRLSEAGPARVTAEWRERHRSGVVLQVPGELTRGDVGWTTELRVPVERLSAVGGFTTWDLWVRIVFADGTERQTRVTATGGMGRYMSRTGHTALLIQPYGTARGRLAMRLAVGMRGVKHVLSGRFRRMPSRRS